MECWPTRLVAPLLAPPISCGISIFVPVESRESFVIMMPLIWLSMSLSSNSDASGCNRLVIKKSRVSSFDGDWCFIQMRASHTQTRATHAWTYCLSLAYHLIIHFLTKFFLTFSPINAKYERRFEWVLLQSLKKRKDKVIDRITSAGVATKNISSLEMSRSLIKFYAWTCPLRLKRPKLQWTFVFLLIRFISVTQSRMTIKIIRQTGQNMICLLLRADYRLRHITHLNY